MLGDELPDSADVPRNVNASKKELNESSLKMKSAHPLPRSNLNINSGPRVVLASSEDRDTLKRHDEGEVPI